MGITFSFWRVHLEKQEVSIQKSPIEATEQIIITQIFEDNQRQEIMPTEEVETSSLAQMAREEEHDGKENMLESITGSAPH